METVTTTVCKKALTPAVSECESILKRHIGILAEILWPALELRDAAFLDCQ